MKKALLIITGIAALACSAFAKPEIKPNSHGIPQLHVDGKPFLMLSGELHNSSSSTLEFMRPALDRCQAANLNTVITTISWETFEPVEGQFDYTLIDAMIKEAEARDLKLVVIWFASYKNGTMAFTPRWVKEDPDRFWLTVSEKGINGWSLSPACEAARDADARAFAALMKRIKEKDRKNTVLMMQVQNEPGTMGAKLDHHPESMKLFKGQVPEQLVNYLDKNRDILVPVMKEAWEANGFKLKGTWEEVFGETGAEAFSCWMMASYMEEVTQAGKAQHDIPMFYNAWLKYPNGLYPRGGPIQEMLDVYFAASPSIDCLAPDIYGPNFKQWCEAYNYPGNMLVIPEVRRDDALAGKAYWAYGSANGALFSPFGVEKEEPNGSLAEGYKVLADIAPMILEAQGSDRMKAVYKQEVPKSKIVEAAEWTFEVGELAEPDGDTTSVEFGNYQFHVQFTKRTSGPAYGLFLQMSDDTFLVTGKNLRLAYRGIGENRGKVVRSISSQQGYFENGEWVVRRQLNGDEGGHGNSMSLPVGNEIFWPEERQHMVMIQLFVQERNAN